MSAAITLPQLALSLAAGGLTTLSPCVFPLLLHRTRRFAIYSAANVDFQGRFALTRPKDVWRVDPRIDAAVQVTDSFYAGN